MWGLGRGAPALERAAVIAGSALSCTGMCDLDSLIGIEPRPPALDGEFWTTGKAPSLLSASDIFGLLPHPPYARNTFISRLLNELLPPWKCCSFRYSNNSCSHFLQIFPHYITFTVRPCLVTSFKIAISVRAFPLSYFIPLYNNLLISRTMYLSLHVAPIPPQY